MNTSIDWTAVEEQLVNTASFAIRRFAGEHPEEVCSFFAYTIDPYADTFEVCLDTYAHSIQEAMKQHFFTSCSISIKYFNMVTCGSNPFLNQGPCWIFNIDEFFFAALVRVCVLRKNCNILDAHHTTRRCKADVTLKKTLLWQRICIPV